MAGLLARLIGRKVAAGHKSAAPADTAVYAVGDIHGRFDLLTALIERLLTDKDAHPDDAETIIVFLGDYIDRGLESKRVLDFLSTGGVPGFRTIYLKGNHEEAMLDFLDGRSDGTAWLTYGGLETLYSYGVLLKGVPVSTSAVVDLREALRAAVPPEHVEFMRSGRLTHVEGDYLFVHAGVRPGIPLERQSPSDLLWIRDEFLSSRACFEGKVVVHGHTICDRPQSRPHRINVDTGAFVSGRLTAAVLRGTTRRFLATGLNADVGETA
jgi:serine/threonine protein phosphatase 1